MFAVFVCLYVLLLPFVTTAAFSGVINDDDDDDDDIDPPRPINLP